MGRPSIDIAPLKDQISKWILEDGLTRGKVVERLCEDYNIPMKRRTLERNLSRWGVTTQSKLLNDKDELSKRLESLFFDNQLTDDEICRTLTEAGFQVNSRSLMRLRKQMGLNKRVKPGTEEELEQTIKDLLEKEYQDPEMKRLGRTAIYTYLRSKYPEHRIIGRDRVFKIARELNPERMKRPRREDRVAHASDNDASPEEAPVSAVEYDTPEGYAPAQEYAPVPRQDYASATEYGQVADEHIDPAFATTTPMTTAVAAEALQTKSRIEHLERENESLHERLHQQEAEIGYLRQAYHDLLARFDAVPDTNSYTA